MLTFKSSGRGEEVWKYHQIMVPSDPQSSCSLFCSSAVIMDPFTAGSASNTSTSCQWDNRQSCPAGADETPSLDSRFKAPGSKGASIRAFQFGNIWFLGTLIPKASFCVSVQSGEKKQFHPTGPERLTRTRCSSTQFKQGQIYRSLKTSTSMSTSTFCMCTRVQMIRHEGWIRL